MEFDGLVEREGFPTGTAVTAFAEAQGRVFRVTAREGERGLDILLTAEAVQMYGEGPTLALILGRLRAAAEAGLPPVQASGEYMRQVFVGD
jgi:hypothetical protein